MVPCISLDGNANRQLLLPFQSLLPLSPAGLSSPFRYGDSEPEYSRPSSFLWALGFSESGSCPCFSVTDVACCLLHHTKGKTKMQIFLFRNSPKAQNSGTQRFSFMVVPFVWNCLQPLYLICGTPFLFFSFSVSAFSFPLDTG